MDRKAMLLNAVRRILQPSELCMGKGCVGRLAALDGQRALVVAALSAEKSGALQAVTSHLEKASIQVAVWCESSAEPTPRRVLAISAKAAECQPDWIVAVGGGATIDAAKLAWAHYEIPALDLTAERPPALGPLRAKARFIAIPTTAGAGSEASQAAVLADEQSGRKIPWVSPQLVPDVAILDPALTTTLPTEITVSSGLDALAHAVEAYGSRLATPMIKTLAAAAVRTILHNLPQACQCPADLEARQHMLDAAYLAGLCQSAASTGLAHALAHSAASSMNARHAMAVGVFLLPVMKYNASHGAAVYQELAKDLGFSTVDEMLGTIERWIADLPISLTLEAAAGGEPTSDQRARLAAGAMADVCLRTNPVRLSEAELTSLIETIS